MWKIPTHGSVFPYPFGQDLLTDFIQRNGQLHGCEPKPDKTWLRRVRKKTRETAKAMGANHLTGLEAFHVREDLSRSPLLMWYSHLAARLIQAGKY